MNYKSIAMITLGLAMLSPDSVAQTTRGAY